jgi:hypothetical protein
MSQDRPDANEGAGEEIEDLEAPGATTEGVVGGAMGCTPPSCAAKDSSFITLCDPPTCNATKSECDDGTHVLIVHQA